MDEVTAGRRAKIVRYAAMGVAVLLVALIGWSFFAGRSVSNTSSPRTAESYIAEYGGEQNVIEAILIEQNCDTLTRTFNAALANARAFGLTSPRSDEQLGRSDAAADRMTALHC